LVSRTRCSAIALLRRSGTVPDSESVMVPGAAQHEVVRRWHGTQLHFLEVPGSRPRCTINSERRASIPTRAAPFARDGDYWSPPTKPEIFQPPASLLKQSWSLPSGFSASGGTKPVLPEGVTTRIIGLCWAVCSWSTRTKCMPSFSTTGELGCALACTSMPCCAGKAQSSSSVPVDFTSASNSSMLKVGSAGAQIVSLRSGYGVPVGSADAAPSNSQPGASLPSSLIALARLSTPDFFLSARLPF